MGGVQNPRRRASDRSDDASEEVIARIESQLDRHLDECAEQNRRVDAKLDQLEPMKLDVAVLRLSLEHVRGAQDAQHTENKARMDALQSAHAKTADDQRAAMLKAAGLVLSGLLTLVSVLGGLVWHFMSEILSKVH